MDLRGLRGRGGAHLLAVVAYVAAACATLALLVWSGLDPAQREQLGDALGGQTATLVLGGVMALAGLVVILGHALGRYPGTARRLASDTRILLGANPEHRLEQSGPVELRDLAAAVNDLAERLRVAEREVAREVSVARADVEQERNRLAALMADLDVAVLVCSLGGRVLLYNTAARSLLADDPALGLGRSVFGIVDWGLVAHALDRVRDGSARAQVSTALRHGRLLQVRLTPVRDPAGEVTGFVIVLEDLTDRQQASSRRDSLLHDLIETTRASLASIQAAVETVLDYPEMDPGERSQFVEIVREESQRLGGQIEGWVTESAALGADWLLTDIQGDDLLAILGREIEREDAVTTSVEVPADGLWVKVDSHAIARAAVHLAVRLQDQGSVQELRLSLARTGRHAGLDVSWTGRAPDAALFKAWLEEPLTGGATGTVQEVVERHDAEIWSSERPDGSAYIRLLLPLTEVATQPVVPAAPEIDSHPPQAEVDLPDLDLPATKDVGSTVPDNNVPDSNVPDSKVVGSTVPDSSVAGSPVPGSNFSDTNFYDFDLFDLPEESRGWKDRRLSDLAYTVFDTETTGFHPADGDEIVSVGAVRIVNGRLLRQETFERLVDPRRSVPARSVAVHGITSEMVRGQPTMDVVLPAFARFAEDTVLVGHNVGFDMSFLRLKEPQAGVRLTQPVLDTLLLDAALHPDHERHSLEAMAARLGVGVVGRHTALGDAMMTGEVFVRLLSLLEQQGISTLGEALAAARATYQARLDAKLYGG